VAGSRSTEIHVTTPAIESEVRTKLFSAKLNNIEADRVGLTENGESQKNPRSLNLSENLASGSKK
jgi:hypothetical protein